MTIDFRLEQDACCGLPPRSFYRLTGVDLLTLNQWFSLASLPGAFVPMPDGTALKATSRELDQWRLQHEDRYPPALAIPRAQWHVGAPAVATINDGHPSAALDFPDSKFHAYDRWIPTLPMGDDPKAGRPFIPDPYQVDAVRQFFRDLRMTLEIPPGLGKTAIALIASEHLFAEGAIDSTVVIAPRRILREVWLDKLGEYYPGREVQGFLVEGTPKRREQILRAASAMKAPYLLTSYDFWRGHDAQLATKLFLGPRAMVIGDETHNLKHVDTARYKAIRDCLDNGPNGVTQRRLLMTGTMVDDKPWDLYGPIQLLGLRTWNSWTEFRDRYFDVKELYVAGRPLRGRGYITGFKDDAAAQDLQQVRCSIGFVRTEEQLGVWLPPGIPESHRVRLSTAEEEVYRDLMKVARDNVTYDGVLASMVAEAQFADDPMLLLQSGSETAQRIREKIGAERLEEMAPGSKFRSFCEWLENFLEGEKGKVLVFSRFAEMVELFRRRFGNSDWCESSNVIGSWVGASTLYFHGQMSEADGSAAFDRFLNDPSIRVFVSTDAGSQGLNYQAASRVVVHYDEPYRMSTLDQREGRVRRRDQPARTVLYPYFQVEASSWLDDELAKVGTEGSIDERIRDLLQEKRSMRRRMEGK
jgi:hypothetical protein